MRCQAGQSGIAGHLPYCGRRARHEKEGVHLCSTHTVQLEHEEQAHAGGQLAPCFKCAERPRMPGHVVCESCHDPIRCERCKEAKWGEKTNPPYAEHQFAVTRPRGAMVFRDVDS